MVGFALLWIFGTYGLGAGVVAASACFYCILRSIVVYEYMSAWVNKEIDPEEKKRRLNLKFKLTSHSLSQKWKTGPT